MTQVNDLSREEVIYLLREYVTILGRHLAQGPIADKRVMAPALNRLNALFSTLADKPDVQP